jgi:hypothetical protein
MAATPSLAQFGAGRRGGLGFSSRPSQVLANGRRGRANEARVANLFKNSNKPSGYAKTNIPITSPTGKRTILDLPRTRKNRLTGFAEVKDAKYVSRSSQFRAQNAIARSEKVPHHLIVGPKTRVSKPAQRDIRATGGKIWRYDSRKNGLRAHENFSPSQRRRQPF